MNTVVVPAGITTRPPPEVMQAEQMGDPPSKVTQTMAPASGGCPFGLMLNSTAPAQAFDGSVYVRSCGSVPPPMEKVSENE